MIVDEYKTTDQRVPGDFRRNGKGQPLVKHPDTGRDTPYDRPSKWFDDYTGIDPIYAMRGTWCHKLTEHIDNGVAWRADLNFVAEGVGLGIPVDTQEEIGRGWVRFLEAHGLTIVHNEANVVNDALKVAGTLDRVVEWQGRRVVLDIKTGSKVEKTAYAVQLARYAASIPYDVDTDERGAWGNDQTIGMIAHLRLNGVLKGEHGVEFGLVAVGLQAAHLAAQTLHDLKSLDLSSGFTIATPTSSPSVVESPGGGDARTENAASPSPTLEQWAADIGDNPAGATLDAEAHAEIVATVRNHRQAPTLDDLRASIDHWTDADKANLRALMVANGVDRTDPDEVSKAIIDYHFHDVATQPVAPAVAPVTTRPTTPTDPDEGPDADEAALGVLEGRYKALDAAGLSWVGGIVSGAQRANTPFHLKVSAGGKRTVRRFEILRGLVSLAAGGFDNDDAVRACLVHAIGAELADSLSFELGRLVGCMGATEAAVFADVAVTLAEGGGSMRWLDDGRCRVEAVAA